MSQPPKVTVAFAVSVLVHVVLFTVLALMPETECALANKESDSTPAEMPLEVVLQNSPAPTPAPERAEWSSTPLDPELKRAAHAPENTQRQAAHDSVAATPRRGHGAGAAAQAAGSPAPASTLALNSPILSVRSARSAQEKEKGVSAGQAGTGVPDGTGNDEEFGIDAVGSYKRAVSNAIAASCKAKGIMSVGEVAIDFAIDVRGAVSGIQVKADNGDPANAKFLIRAICEAKLPAPPSDLLAHQPGDRKFFKCSYTFFRIPTP